jgi:hypothetical protein
MAPRLASLFSAAADDPLLWWPAAFSAAGLATGTDTRCTVGILAINLS